MDGAHQVQSSMQVLEGKYAHVLTYQCRQLGVVCLQGCVCVAVGVDVMKGVAPMAAGAAGCCGRYRIVLTLLSEDP